MKIYLVGGAVRDELLHFPFRERDWLVVGSTPEAMIEQGFRPVGKDFPVFLHPQTGEEYALARTERKTAPGYGGFQFSTDPSVTLEDDLLRRDLTINAIAKNPSGEIVDPYGGEQDLNNKQLRHVSQAFAEDPVRILRIARFLARYQHLGFSIAGETLALMQKMVAAGETQHLVAERVWQECCKALAEATPRAFFESLDHCGALKDIFPECLKRLPQCLLALDRVASASDSPILRFAGLCHPLPEADCALLCSRLRVPKQYAELSQLIHKIAGHVVNNNALDASAIALIFQQGDALRKAKRFTMALEAISLLYDTPLCKAFWEAALGAYQNVDPKRLMAEGYRQAALGQAIHKQRIQQLDNFLNQQ
ncbi:MAG: multifunctional CCA tRNA nucleotidyl transferase/2'3'-cyclic phosphodiesterase/2'nucleotidase/phosphatase [Pseudomonadota bacterium]